MVCLQASTEYGQHRYSKLFFLEKEDYVFKEWIYFHSYSFSSHEHRERHSIFLIFFHRPAVREVRAGVHGFGVRTQQQVVARPEFRLQTRDSTPPGGPARKVEGPRPPFDRLRIPGSTPHPPPPENTGRGAGWGNMRG